MSSYTGLYVQRLEDGTIYSVQVIDIGGIDIPLDPQIYRERNINPPIELLPDQKNYQKNSA
ncbi:MAG: hypothetical protein NTW85_05730 [Methylococcales bacterium]|nr:hypothetical protein [Methylococcales bacterium]